VASSANSVILGTPHVLLSIVLQGYNFGPYAVSPDGKRFLLNGAVSAQDAGTPLTLVTNWTAELKK
jgi:hypothetical protein